MFQAGVPCGAAVVVECAFVPMTHDQVGNHDRDVSIRVRAGQVRDKVDERREELAIRRGQDHELGLGDARPARKVWAAIALTAYARIEGRTRALVAGFNMHVPKPVEPAELVAVVSSLAGRLRENPGSSR